LLYKRREDPVWTSSIPGATKRAIGYVRFHVYGFRAGGCQEDDRSSQCMICGTPGHKVRECNSPTCVPCPAKGHEADPLSRKCIMLGIPIVIEEE